ncbi:MAG: four helix bundle protein [Candidatus Yanofskybacteria bacterium]|nr:four helix bundle protein [Candidatus Yanofskybacteria bacterium]
MYNYEKLEVYKLSLQLVVTIYVLVKKFPKDEIFGLTSQLKRAAVSVLLNIVEGSSRSSKKDFAVFIDRSIGSTVEVRASLQVAVELKFTTEKDIVNILELIDKLYFKLQKLKKYLRS